MDFLVAQGPALLFFAFAALAVVAAVCVVTLRNPMYGAIALLVSFLAVAALFLLRHAEFVAVVQIFVYGGGVMVLFLFVIMLVNLHRLPETRQFLTQSPLGILAVVLLVALLGTLLVQVRFGAGGGDLARFVTADGVAAGNTEAVALSLYRDYLLPFEIASIFLLVAMIGAVVLGRRQ